MKIGEVAKLTGCKVVTVRFYEQKGLLRKPERSGSNYREYNAEDVQRLQFILHCRKHGMSLEEIGELCGLEKVGGASCQHVHRIISGHLEKLDRQIGELIELKDELQAMLSQCPGRSGAVCDILQELKAGQQCAHCQQAAVK